MKSNYSREERQKIVAEYIQSGKSQTVFEPEYIEEVHRYVYECQNCLEDTYNWQGICVRDRYGKNVLDFLEGYAGNVIQSDGYSGYNAAINYWNFGHQTIK